MTDTSIRISSENRDRLRSEKQGGESYDEVIDRMIKDSHRLDRLLGDVEASDE